MAKPGRSSQGFYARTSLGLASLASLSSESFGSHPILLLLVITRSYYSLCRNAVWREQPKGTGERSILPWLQAELNKRQGTGLGDRVRVLGTGNGDFPSKSSI